MPALTSLVNPNSAVITNADTNPVSVILSSKDDSIAEIAFYLGKLVKMSEALAVVDTNQRQRVAVENSLTVGSVGSVGGTVLVNGSNSNFKPVDNTNNPVYSISANAFGVIYGAVPEIWRTIDIARQNFQTSIRTNLTFS